MALSTKVEAVASKPNTIRLFFFWSRLTTSYTQSTLNNIIAHFVSIISKIFVSFYHFHWKFKPFGIHMWPRPRPRPCTCRQHLPLITNCISIMLCTLVMHFFFLSVPPRQQFVLRWAHITHCTHHANSNSNSNSIQRICFSLAIHCILNGYYYDSHLYPYSPHKFSLNCGKSDKLFVYYEFERNCYCMSNVHHIKFATK